MSEPEQSDGEAVEALAAAERAFDRGDHKTARQLLEEPLRAGDEGLSERAREVAEKTTPERCVLIVGVVCAVLISVLFGYYVIAR